MLGALRPAGRATSMNFASKGRPERFPRCCGWTFLDAIPCAKSDGAKPFQIRPCKAALRVMRGFRVFLMGTQARHPSALQKSQRTPKLECSLRAAPKVKGY